MMTCEFILAAALLAPAQADAVPGTGTTFTTRVVFDLEMSRRPVDEAVEVMRALLLRRLQPTGVADNDADKHSGYTRQYFYEPVQTPDGKAPFGSRAVLTPTADTSAYFYDLLKNNGQNATVEGAYLDGYGVVFTVTLPASGRDPRPGAAEPTEKPGLSDWEREQRRIRGEAQPARAPTMPKELPVGDLLLKLLAENGKHFTSLKEDERVTIAVTFRGSAPQATAAKTESLGSGGTLTGAGLPGGTMSYVGSSPVMDRVVSFENLGDLHLKQGQPQKAIDAYAKAAEQAENELKSATNAPPDYGSYRDRIHESLTKLAQAYVAAGKMDEARDVMDRAKAVREKRAQSAPPAVKPPAAIRPARLNFSASKALLDQVGNGKKSLDEFRKLAVIEYVPAGKAAE